ncbi:MAG: response regulator [Candidatus Diapherotrites archaeon]|nr:response regulator [Candidatus Micrarchaeota archaeon]MBU1939188.1 response regulator [Candidatus Micrarchaeota archaeon]
MPKILVVDDSGYTRMMIKDAIGIDGHTDVEEASSGEEAIKKAKALKPALILLDLILVGKGGMEVLAEVKKTQPKTKVIVISAVGQQSYLKKATDLGADAYLVKPVGAKEIRTKVKQILGK